MGREAAPPAEELLGEYVPREVRGKPSTPRVQKLLDQLYYSEHWIDSERCALYTKYIKEHWNDPPFTRQGGALKYVLSNLTPVINEGELIVGQISRYFRGTQVYPEYEPWVLEEFRGITRPEERYVAGALREVKAKEEDILTLSIYKVTRKDAEIIKEAAEFWEGKDVRSIAEKYYLDPETKEFFLKCLANGLVAPPGVMWDVPEGRVIVNYERVLKEGLEGIIQRCKQKQEELKPLDSPEKLRKYDFYQGIILACEGLIRFAERYAEKAEELAKECGDEKRRQELLEIARICRKVPRKPAETFREAIQSFWFVHCALHIEMNGRGISPGRFDQYMYPYYKKDLEEGRITREEALELLELLRIKMSQLIRAHPLASEGILGGSMYQNVTLGGLDKNGNSAENELSYLVLEAGINVPTWQPTLSVRWNDKLSLDFKKAVVRAIKAGNGYPAIFCDKPAIEWFLKVTKAPLEDALDWAPCGCVDMQICGKRAPMHAILHFNMPKILELIIFKGVNPVTGEKVLDIQIDPDTASFEEIVQEFKRIVDLLARKFAEIENIRALVKNQMGLVLPLTSALLDDCIEKGLHCQEGGCRYNDSPYMISCGMVNVANSLASIKWNIYDNKFFSMSELREALKNNFQGYERILRLCLDAPKYGNDDDYVDQILVDLYDAWSEIVQRYKNWMGEPFRPSILSVITQVVLGKACGATPDGRRAFEPLADGGISPHPGTDKKGPTAVIKSATKVKAAGKLQSTLLNQKFNPLALWGEKNTEKFVAYLDTYYELGGYHIQFNIVDSRMLRDAQKHPEKYPDLMVRVAGFTARFVELGKDAQDEIIKRTEFMEAW